MKSHCRNLMLILYIALLIIFLPITASAEEADYGHSDSGHVIVIDPGHQAHGNPAKEPIGPGAHETKAKVTTGATGVSTKIPESELCLSVGMKLKAELESRGYTVIMTRTGNDVDISNSERAAVANEAKADAFIRIHANSVENSSVTGAMTICQTDKNPYNAYMADTCYRLSECVLDGMTNQTGVRKMSVLRTDNMSGINWSTVPVTIIEMGFMSNPHEDELMATEDFQNNAAIGIANGIDSFFSEDIDIVLGFAGDFNLDENWATTIRMDSLDNGIEDCISENLIAKMKSFDYFMLNNEYTYSTRGTPTPGKSYTFRADPERVKILDELGVDLVLLANNHVADYGEDALIDTLKTLEADNIPYVGAGRNITEAAKPYYYKVGDYTIAYCAASCAESYSAKYWTQAATDSHPGILSCYDPEIFLKSIKEARENADYVIANIHWGLEYSYARDDFQEELGKRAIDSGADIIIGSHPHVLQGIDFYKESPIFYSLGNYWFNNKDLYSELVYVSLHLSGDHHELTVNDYGLIPCTQYGLYTSSDEDSEEWKDIISFLNKISYNAVIDDEGKVTEKGRKVQ